MTPPLKPWNQAMTDNPTLQLAHFAASTTYDNKRTSLNDKDGRGHV
jgi:hypothetical protein